MDFKNAKEKTLIVGESHYADNNLKSEEVHRHPYLTRTVINGKAIKRIYSKSMTFLNLHKAIMKNDSFDSQKFWNKLAFYNFIQRPSVKDFKDGWEIFFKVVDIINNCWYKVIRIPQKFCKNI